ncbi:MAG: hypothetical protein RR540_06555 [Oscillospiraceae bacterium]
MAKNVNERTKFSDNRFLMSFLVFAVAAAILAVAAFSIFTEMNTYEENIITSFGKEQQILVNQVSAAAQEILDKNGQGLTNEVVEKVVKKAETNGSRFWFFGINDEFIFFQNGKSTELVEGISLTEFAKNSKINGGENADEFLENVTARNDGFTLASTMTNAEKQLFSIDFFTAKDDEYFVGIATNERYILSEQNAKSHTTYIFLYSLAFSVIFLMTAIFSLIYVLFLKKKLLRNQKEIRDKNKLVLFLNTELSSQNETSVNIYDYLTGIYNLDFFNAALKKSSTAKFYPLGIISITLTSNKEIPEENLIKTADIIRANIKKSDIPARNKNEFLVLSINTSKISLDKICHLIEKNITSELGNNFCKIGLDFALESEISVEKVLENARKSAFSKNTINF